MNHKMITAQSLADELDLSVETIWRYTRENKIPYIKLGSKQYRYRLTEVIEALDSSSVNEKKEPYKTDENKNLTYQDYLELPDEPGFKHEILEGIIVKEPSPGVIHQRVSRRLIFILKDYFDQKELKGELFFAPLDLTLNDKNVIQPDILYIPSEKQNIIKNKRIDGSPLLIIEIISPHSKSKDRIQKMNIYQKLHVKHYWIVDPEEKTFECFSLQDNTYSLLVSGMENDIIEDPGFPELKISLKKIWYGENSES